MEGTCTSFAAPVPAVSPRGIWIVFALLVAIAVLALWRRDLLARDRS